MTIAAGKPGDAGVAAGDGKAGGPSARGRGRRRSRSASPSPSPRGTLTTARTVAAVAVLLVAAVTVAGSLTSAPRAGASVAPAVTLVNAYGDVWDVSFDGVLVTGPDGLAVGSVAVDRGAGPVTVGVFPHVSGPPSDSSGRTDSATQMEVTVAAADSVSIVIGHAPAGGAGLPFVSTFVNDVSPPAAGTGRFVLRHTADAAPMDFEIISTATEPRTVVARGTLARGAETSVDVPVPAATTSLVVMAKRQGSTYAVPPELQTTAQVGRGEIVIAYASGPIVRAPVAGPDQCAAPGAIPPPGASAITSTIGDFDGDRGPDVLYAWSEVVNGTTTWSLGLVPAHGNGTVQALTEPLVGPVAVLGAADANADGKDDAFLSVAQGAVPDQVQVWGYGNCAFAPATIHGLTTASTFLVGGTGADRDGVSCSYDSSGAQLSIWTVRPGTGSDLQVTRSDHRWNGLVLTPSAPPATQQVPSTDEVTLGQASTLACGVPTLALVLTAPAVPTAPPVTTPTTVLPVRVTPRFTG